jgi:signal transduction histidine kinase
VLCEHDAQGAVARCSELATIDTAVVAGRNGLAAVNALRTNQARIPIVLVCESEDFDLATEALRLEICECLLSGEMTSQKLSHAIRNAVSRSRTKEKLLQKEREKILDQRRHEAISELVVTICHEFNNPLAAIKISRDIISREQLLETDRHVLQGIEQTILSIEKKIARLRDLNLFS